MPIKEHIKIHQKELGDKRTEYLELEKEAKERGRDLRPSTIFNRSLYFTNIQTKTPRLGAYLLYGPKYSGKTMMILKIRDIISDLGRDGIYVSAKEVGEVDPRELRSSIVEVSKEMGLRHPIVFLDDFADLDPKIIDEILLEYVGIAEENDFLVIITGSFAKDFNRLLKKIESVYRSFNTDKEKKAKVLIQLSPKEFPSFLVYKYPKEVRVLMEERGSRSKIGNVYHMKYYIFKYIALRSLSPYLSYAEMSRGESYLKKLVENLTNVSKQDLSKFFRNQYLPYPSRYPSVIKSESNFVNTVSVLAEAIGNVNEEVRSALEILRKNLFSPIEIDLNDPIIKEALSYQLIVPFRYFEPGKDPFKDPSDKIVPVVLDKVVYEALREAFGDAPVKPDDFLLSTILHAFVFKSVFDTIEVPVNIYIGKFYGRYIVDVPLDVDPYMIELMLYVLNDDLPITQYRTEGNVKDKVEKYSPLFKELALLGLRHATTPIVVVKDYYYEYDFFRVHVEPNDQELEEFRSKLYRYVTYGTFPQNPETRDVGIFPAYELFTLFVGTRKTNVRRDKGKS